MQDAAQYRLMVHGMYVLMTGLVGGLFLAFNLVGNISLPPLPIIIDYQIPGDAARWRPVHTGGLMNGIMAIGLAAIFPYIEVTDRWKNRLSWGIVLSIWGNVMFYVFGVFAPNRGLTPGTNQLGEGNLAGALAFWPAYIAAFVTIGVVAVMIRNLQKPQAS